MPNDPKTVRVRIAVAVDSTSDWSSIGYARMKEDDAHSFAAENIGAVGEALYWIEADLPVPEVKTVQGEVREVGE